ncbi:MAG: hypothetical protein K0R72_1243 [Clostridia bacterium]|nr:hypothetical protein [Clostridia bacterium]
MKIQIIINDNILKEAIIGNIITFSLLEHETNETDIYTLKLVNHSKYNTDEVSLDSPIGKNIHKTHIGDVVPYMVNSNKFTITILNIEVPV